MLLNLIKESLIKNFLSLNKIMEGTTKIIKIISTSLIILGLAGILLYGACKSELTEEDKQAIQQLEDVLIMKHKKQNCLDNLTYLESMENSKGILHCSQDDEDIKTKRESLLAHIRWEEYENVDNKIAEKVVTNTGMTSIEKLSFLLSE